MLSKQTNKLPEDVKNIWAAPDTSSHAENFSFKDFFPTIGSSLAERVKPCSNWLHTPNPSIGPNACMLTYFPREVVGPIENRTLIKDPLTGEIRSMLMFGSNNYLGLTTHPYVREAAKRAIEEFGVGMGGPPLLNGMSSIHRQLEARIAQFKGAEDALLFASGFQAQLGWVNGLLRDDDILICDELGHASLYDAIKLVSMGSRVRAFNFKHNDCDELEQRLIKCKQVGGASNRLIYVAVEGVYSMDGDLAPLPAIRELCDHYGAVLVVDDAHGTGVMGKKGGGTDEHFGLKGRIDVTMGTFSKALGVTGGFIAASRDVIEYLRFFARSYMFSASLPVPIVAAVLAGLDVIEREPERISQLRANSAYLLQQLQEAGFQASSDSAIIPVRIPAEVEIRTLAWRFHQEGIFVNSVEYPAVPLNAQRLRISVMATHTREDLDTFIHVFQKLDRELGIVR